jgi:hypothetical protein
LSLLVFEVIAGDAAEIAMTAVDAILIVAALAVDALVVAADRVLEAGAGGEALTGVAGFALATVGIDAALVSCHAGWPAIRLVTAVLGVARATQPEGAELPLTRTEGRLSRTALPVEDFEHGGGPHLPRQRPETGSQAALAITGLVQVAAGLLLDRR